MYSKRQKLPLFYLENRILDRISLIHNYNNLGRNAAFQLIPEVKKTSSCVKSRNQRNKKNIIADNLSMPSLMSLSDLTVQIFSKDLMTQSVCDIIVENRHEHCKNVIRQ
jgi:hypothetical protein